MDYVDYTVVRLADESTRSALFDQLALEQLAAAAYDAESVALGGPYTAVFDEVSVGLSLPRRGSAEAYWGPSTGSDRHEGRVALQGFGDDSGPRVDALWRGALIARASSPSAPIERVVTAWPDASGIDEELARTAPLPTEPGALERARRQVLLARLRAGMGQPAVLTEAAFDGWLRGLGVDSVGALMARSPNQLGTATLQLEFAAPAEPVSAPRRLPIVAAILVRDRPLAVAQLLADSKRVRDRLHDLGVERAPAPGLAPRAPVLVAWMVPDLTFDDPDWPGGEPGTNDLARRTLRRAAAGRWLAREGLGLVTTPAHPAT